MTVLGIDVGRKNLALCLIRPGADALGRDDAVLRWAVLSLDPSPAGVAACLDGVRDWADDWPAVAVAIERQPAKNPTMKRLEHYIEMFFAQLGCGVSTVDAKHKLAFAARTPWWPRRDVPNWTYAERKKLSVETVTNWLRDVAPPDDFGFSASKKKDDFADSLLHAMAFAHVVGPALGPALGPTRVRRIKPAKPTDAQVKSGRYSQAGLKHVCRAWLGDRDAFETGLATVRGARESCERHFGSIDNAFVQLN